MPFSVKLTLIERIKKVQQKAPRIQFTLVKNVKEFNHFASNSIVTVPLSHYAMATIVNLNKLLDNLEN